MSWGVEPSRRAAFETNRSPLAGANIQRILNRDCEGEAHTPPLPRITACLHSLNSILDGVLHPDVGFSFSAMKMDGIDVIDDDVRDPKEIFSQVYEV